MDAALAKQITKDVNTVVRLSGPRAPRLPGTEVTTNAEREAYEQRVKEEAAADASALDVAWARLRDVRGDVVVAAILLNRHVVRL